MVSKMQNQSGELLEIAEKIETLAADAEKKGLRKLASDVAEATKLITLSHCGSWIGYHSCVYYEGFKPPPMGAFFNPDKGLEINPFTSERFSKGDWKEYSEQEIDEALNKKGARVLTEEKRFIEDQERTFRRLKSDVIISLASYLNSTEDGYIRDAYRKIDNFDSGHSTKISMALMPDGQQTTRDIRAANGGLRTPRHIQIFAEAGWILKALRDFESAAKVVRSTANYITKINAQGLVKVKSSGKKIFIGHGRALEWLKLQSYIEKELNLQCEEFNSVATAGMTTQERLSAMLDNAAMAFLVMTGEDEGSEGEIRARMNVVHEIGLFQGRLGLRKGIIILEETCSEFSNIVGLTQIRYPKGHIEYIFSQVAAVLKREGL